MIARPGALALAVALVCAPPACAQGITLGAHGARLTRQDGDARWAGTGFGASLMLARGGLRVSGVVSRGTLSPASGANVATDDITLTALDVRAAYRILPFLRIEAGATAERATPELAARDVGGVWAGVRLETGMGAGTTAWVSAAAAPITRSNGGAAAGSGGLPTGVGFGAEAAITPRIRATAAYTLVRMDKFTVQSSSATIGARVNLF